MATLNVKGLPDGLYRALQARARRERRSVAQEVTRILAEAVARVPGAPALAREHAEPYGLQAGDLAALRARLERVRRRRSGKRLADDLTDLALECAALPVLDPRPADDILGYGDEGLPR